MSNGSNRWIGANISPELFDAVYELCSILGRQLKFVAPELIERGVAAMVKEIKNPTPELKLWNSVRNVDRQNNRMDMLRRLGGAAKESGDTDVMEEFVAHCEAFGYDPADVLRKAETLYGPAQPIDVMPRGNSVDACVKWLKRKLMPSEKYAQKEIMAQAYELGFKKWAVDRAKRRLGIKSEWGSGGWDWYLPEPEGLFLEPPEEESDYDKAESSDSSFFSESR